MFNSEIEVLTIEDLMEILFVGRNYAYKLLNSGSIKGFKIGRSWRIPRSSIEEFIINSCRSSKQD